MNVGDSDFSGALGDLISSFINGLHTYIVAAETLEQAMCLWQLLCTGSY